MTNVIAWIVAILLILITIVGYFYWRYARSMFYSQEPKKDVYHGVKEGEATFLDGFKNDWTGSPWWGRPRRGGLLWGFSPVAFTYLFCLVLLIVPEGKEDYFIDWFMVIDLFLYFTWVCYRQNLQAMKMAKHLSKDTVRVKELYQKAFKYWPTKYIRWLAPWLGLVFYLKFKKQMSTLPEYVCPTCGVPMEKDESFRLSEAHECETKYRALHFEPYRCSHGHVFVMTDKGEQFDAFSFCPNCKVYALKNVREDIVKKANFVFDGKKEVTSVCQHCGRTVMETIEYEK